MKQLLVVVAVLFIASACAVKPPIQPPLDHFKCYSTEDKPLEQTVVLRDQFGKAEAKVLNPTWFCNPVKKVHDDRITPILNRDHHLKFYRIESKEPALPRPRVVYVYNQFGQKQKMEVTQPMYLAVPTQKLYPHEHKPPEKLDHFKCYQAEGEPIKAIVDLQDQFLTEKQVSVQKPMLLCNPAAKEMASTAGEIFHPEAHLMCYQMKGKDYEAKVKTKNQFGEEGLSVNQAGMLCVPSFKKS